MSAFALIVAGGRGERLGADLPKQYLALGGRPVLRHTVERFAEHPSIEGVKVVIRPEDRDLYDAAVDGLDLLPPSPGGATRQESVLNGLTDLTDHKPAQVLIQDAARPFTDDATIDRALAALDRTPGAVAALPVVDSLKRGNESVVAGDVDRAGLWRAQTPQAFRFDDILHAHRAAAGQGLTDDAAVAAQAGLAVTLVAGSEDNFKITSADDMARAERLYENRLGETRIGSGFDVHRFGGAGPIMLCGIEVEHEHGLAGHSDADVGLHALTDAILGAFAAGDIGDHFPPSDPQWAGAPSDRFLRHAADLLGERGGSISGVDLTLICERPKIGPHRTAMRMRVAEILGIPVERVSVKATTTERLGFTGRGEGIAAQATATIRLPS